MFKNKILFHLIRIFIGSVFILSAVLKLLSADLFELYIFSQHLFSFNVSAILARLIISVELLTGILLISGLYYKKVYNITVFLLIGFSIFLLFKLFGPQADENCNCFGELIQMTPLESLIKNIVLLLLLFTVRKLELVKFKYAGSVLIVAVTFAVSFPVVISRPDFIINWEKNKIDLNHSGELIRTNETLNQLKVSDGKKLVCFFSVTCQYCELAARKISIIVEDHGLQQQTVYVFTGDKNQLPVFWETSNSEQFTYTFLELKPFFKIAGPSVPSVFLLDDGLVVKQYNYRNINENEIKDFFGR